MDIAEAHAHLNRALPDLHIRTVEVMDEGWESFVFDINGALIAKFPRAAWVVDKYRREQRLLDAIGDATNLVAVPRPRLIEGDTLIQIYDKLPGEMLTDVVERGIDTASVGAQLGRFLKTLHTLDRSTIARTGLDPYQAVRWVERWHNLISRIEADVLPLLSDTARRAAKVFFAERITDDLGVFRPTVTHADVGGWNILVDRATSSVTALIDWGDAEIGDPAFDFTAIRADHTRPLSDALLAGYGAIPDDGFLSRIETYARLHLLSSALFARNAGRRDYEMRYLTMAERTFGGG